MKNSECPTWMNCMVSADFPTPPPPTTTTRSTDGAVELVLPPVTAAPAVLPPPIRRRIWRWWRWRWQWRRREQEAQSSTRTLSHTHRRHHAHSQRQPGAETAWCGRRSAAALRMHGAPPPRKLRLSDCRLATFWRLPVGQRCCIKVLPAANLAAVQRLAVELRYRCGRTGNHDVVYTTRGRKQLRRTPGGVKKCGRVLEGGSLEVRSSLGPESFWRRPRKSSSQSVSYCLLNISWAFEGRKLRDKACSGA